MKPGFYEIKYLKLDQRFYENQNFEKIKNFNLFWFQNLIPGGYFWKIIIVQVILLS